MAMGTSGRPRACESPVEGREPWLVSMAELGSSSSSASSGITEPAAAAAPSSDAEADDDAFGGEEAPTSRGAAAGMVPPALARVAALAVATAATIERCLEAVSMEEIQRLCKAAGVPLGARRTDSITVCAFASVLHPPEGWFHALA